MSSDRSETKTPSAASGKSPMSLPAKQLHFIRSTDYASQAVDAVIVPYVDPLLVCDATQYFLKLSKDFKCPGEVVASELQQFRAIHGSKEVTVFVCLFPLVPTKSITGNLICLFSDVLSAISENDAIKSVAIAGFEDVCPSCDTTYPPALMATLASKWYAVPEGPDDIHVFIGGPNPASTQAVFKTFSDRVGKAFQRRDSEDDSPRDEDDADTGSGSGSDTEPLTPLDTKAVKPRAASLPPQTRATSSAIPIPGHNRAHGSDLKQLASSAPSKRNYVFVGGDACDPFKDKHSLPSYLAYTPPKQDKPRYMCPVCGVSIKKVLLPCGHCFCEACYPLTPKKGGFRDCMMCGQEVSSKPTRIHLNISSAQPHPSTF